MEQDNKQTIELLPCPFCGMAPRVTEGRMAIYVACGNQECDCAGSFPLSGWNSRADIASPPASWNPIETAPKDARWLIALMSDGEVVRAHWAEGDGENQPPFRGWFRQGHGSGEDYFVEIDKPVGWMPLPSPPTKEQSK